MTISEQVSVLAGKEFQLEEREDRDSEQSRLWLNADGTVTLQDTDGPQFTTFEGRWSVVDIPGEKQFRMLLDRVYGGGMKARFTTDVGEFDYTVRREFFGDVVQVVENVVGVEGVVHLLDNADDKDYPVGYFALTDLAAIEEESTIGYRKS
jgi:hypothetical protein